MPKLKPAATKPELTHIRDLIPDPRNARLHNPRNVGLISDSLREVGAARSIVIDDLNTVLAGNGVLEAASEAGITKVQVVDADGETIIAVRRSGLTDAQKVRLALFDNRAGDLSTWSPEVLKQLKADGADLSNLWGADELAELFAATEPKGGLTDPDDVPAERATDIVAGDLFELGAHRLLCGDCTKSVDVNRLVDTYQAALAFTSPPYAQQRTEQYGGIAPESYIDWWESVQATTKTSLTHDGSFFVNIKEHCDKGQRHLYVKELTIAHVQRWGWEFVDEFAWVHGGTPTDVERRFKNGWEPVFHFAKSHAIRFRPDAVRHPSESVPGKYADRRRGRIGAAKSQGITGDIFANDSHTAGLAYPSNALKLGKNRESLGHPAAFPVSLPAFFIEAFSDQNDMAYEPFAGSGSTLIACEQLGRRCCAIEIDQSYCQMIIDRWQAFSGKTATKVGEAIRA